jgi:dCMP deaminase
MQQRVVVAYVPVPHRGYIEFFRRHGGGVLYILGRELIEKFDPLNRHLPGNAPEETRRMVASLGLFESVRILTPENAHEVRQYQHIVMPDEDISHVLVVQFFGSCNITLEGHWRLRWHKDAVLQGRRPEGELLLTKEHFHQEMMGRALFEAQQSPDWWRQVGAVLVRDGEILLTAYNNHYPHEQSAYIEGDPRSNFSAGEHIDRSLALHAEMAIISAAAREGIPTKGCDLYVSTFPCPPCANALANSGIRRLYYADGYSLIAGAESLTSRGVEIVRVLMPPLV